LKIIGIELKINIKPKALCKKKNIFSWPNQHWPPLGSKL